MICMFTTTYSESVISIPIWDMGEPIGPILNGITYMVRPFMHPVSNFINVCFISLGSTQLLVGPACSFLRLQINVRSSTLATSLGSLKQAKLFGLLEGFSRTKVPRSTSASHISLYSSWEPSHHLTCSG